MKMSEKSEFEPFEKELKQATREVLSALSYEQRKTIGIRELQHIAKQIPKAFGVKCLLTKGEEEVCFIDRGETYADTLIFRPSKLRNIFVVGAWGDYTK
jgi:hypothetical protein